MERRRAGVEPFGRELPGVGRELRMLLPAQHAAAERESMVLVASLGRDEPAPNAEIDQCRAIGFAALARGVEGEVQHAVRNFDRRERPRMDFAEHRRAQPMRLEPLAFPDHRLGAHGEPRGMRRLL